MDILKVGDIISFPAEAKFAYGVTFKRPTATREFIIEGRRRARRIPERSSCDQHGP
jgi:hypothetical protein